MRLFVDLVEGPCYIDVMLTPAELEKIRAGEMITKHQTIKNRMFFVGAFLDRRTKREKEEEPEESQEGDA